MAMLEQGMVANRHCYHRGEIRISEETMRQLVRRALQAWFFRPEAGPLNVHNIEHDPQTRTYTISMALDIGRNAWNEKE
jgi:hypothetical protein